MQSGYLNLPLLCYEMIPLKMVIRLTHMNCCALKDWSRKQPTFAYCVELPAFLNRWLLCSLDFLQISAQTAFAGNLFYSVVTDSLQNMSIM